jgi:hypothetical protein
MQQASNQSKRSPAEAQRILGSLWDRYVATGFRRVSSGYGLTEPWTGTLYITVMVVGCLCGGALLHWIGRRILGRLVE